MSEISMDLIFGRQKATVKIGARRDRLFWSLPGPDFRFRWGSAEVPLDRLQQLDDAVTLGFEQLEPLMAATPAGAELQKRVVIESHELELRVGGYRPGLVVFPNAENASQCTISSSVDLQDFRSLLATAAQKAPALRALLEQGDIHGIPEYKNQQRAADADVGKSTHELMREQYLGAAEYRRRNGY